MRGFSFALVRTMESIILSFVLLLYAILCKSQALHRKFTSALSDLLFMILHPRVDGAGAVDLFGEDKAGQLVGHRDAAHAEPERRRALDLVREAVGRADDEGHVSRAAVCAVGEELRQLLGGDLFSLDAQGDDGRAPADAAEDGSALFVQRLFHHGVGGVLLFDFFFRQLDDAERRKRRQTLLVFGHALGEVFRVELADADQVDILHGYRSSFVWVLALVARGQFFAILESGLL